MGRQPWVVVPNPTGDQMVRLTVQQGVSDHSAGTVFFSLAVFTLLYGALAVVWFWLMRRYVDRRTPGTRFRTGTSHASGRGRVRPLSFAY